MSKIVQSPVKKWPGSVVISDPLTFPQVFAFEDAINAIQEQRDNITGTKADGIILPGILACVEKWQLQGLPEQMTVDTFPATPRLASSRLIAWLIGEISKLYQDAQEEIPNE